MNRVWSFVLQQCSLACSVSQDKYLIEQCSKEGESRHKSEGKYFISNIEEFNYILESRIGIRTSKGAKPDLNCLGATRSQVWTANKEWKLFPLSATRTQWERPVLKLVERTRRLDLAGKLPPTRPRTTRTHLLRSVPSE